MTSKLTREWLKHQISAIEAVGITDSNTLAAFKLALAAMDSEPVKRVNADQMHHVCLEANRHLDKYGAMAKEVNKLLGRIPAQPAPVVNGEYGDAYQGAREDLAIWKRRALDAEESVRRLEQINDHLVKEAQGESRMGEPVIAQPEPVVPDEMLCEFYEVANWPDLVRELVKHVEQLQDSAKRNVKPWEDTFPETLLPAYIDRIKQADEACRAAMLQAGNSPVIPDTWIPVSERMPENKPGCYKYLVFETLNNRVNNDYWNVPDKGDEAFTPFWNYYGEHVTHWMPLPAAPQEAK